MISTKNLSNEIINMVLNQRSDGLDIENLLENWAHSIIDECAEEATVETQSDFNYIDEPIYISVVDKSSIYNVKNILRNSKEIL